MKKLPTLTLASCALLAGTFAAPSVQADPPQIDGVNWRVVFEDDFEGDTLDPTKWSIGYPWGNGHQHNHGAWCVEEQVTVEDGKLVITGLNQRHPDAPEDLPYTSGLITTFDTLHLTGGYIEGSFKMPAGDGVWPAFWTLNTAGGWPPELDILEVPHEPTRYFVNTHWRGDGRNRSSGRWIDTPNLTESFNTFGVLWNTEGFTYYFNGRAVKTVNNPSAIEQCRNMYILINLAMGGWGGEVTEGPDYVARYECDWVRVWQTHGMTHSLPMEEAAEATEDAAEEAAEAAEEATEAVQEAAE